MLKSHFEVLTNVTVDLWFVIAYRLFTSAGPVVAS
jgi:hypothetical protein